MSVLHSYRLYHICSRLGIKKTDGAALAQRRNCQEQNRNDYWADSFAAT